MNRHKVRSVLGAALTAALLGVVALPRLAGAEPGMPPVTPFKPPCPSPAKCVPAQLQALEAELSSLVAQIKIAIEVLHGFKAQIAAVRAEKEALQEQAKQLDMSRPVPPVRQADEDDDAFAARMNAYTESMEVWDEKRSVLEDKIKHVSEVLDVALDRLAKVKIEIAALQKKIGAVLKYTADVVAGLPPAHGFRAKLLEARGRVGAESARLQAAIKQLPAQ